MQKQQTEDATVAFGSSVVKERGAIPLGLKARECTHSVLVVQGFVLKVPQHSLAESAVVQGGHALVPGCVGITA